MMPTDIKDVIYCSYENSRTTYHMLEEINKLKDPLLKAAIIFPLLGAMLKHDRYAFSIAEIDLILEILKSSSSETKYLILAKVKFLGKIDIRKQDKEELPKETKKTEEMIGKYQIACSEML